VSPDNVTLFIEFYKVWPEVQPYIDLIFTAEEMQLIRVMEGKSLRLLQIAERMDLTLDQAHHLLQNAY